MLKCPPGYSHTPSGMNITPSNKMSKMNIAATQIAPSFTALRCGQRLRAVRITQAPANIATTKQYTYAPGTIRIGSTSIAPGAALPVAYGTLLTQEPKLSAQAL